jgi:hypothetical protein
MVKNHYTLALVSVSKSEKDTVITKKKDFDESASKGKIADLTAQIKLQDNEGEKTIYVSESQNSRRNLYCYGWRCNPVEEKVARIDDAICAVRALRTVELPVEELHQ